MPAFTVTKYEGDDGEIYGVRLSPSKFAVAGTPPAGAATSNIKAKVSKSRREFGIKPRGVTVARTIGTGDDTFKKYSFVPVLTPAAFGTATFAIGADITFSGFTWTITAKVPEDY